MQLYKYFNKNCKFSFIIAYYLDLQLNIKITTHEISLDQSQLYSDYKIERHGKFRI